MPQKPYKRRRYEKEPKGMDSLFPVNRARRKGLEDKNAAFKKAKWLLSVIDGLAAKGYIERDQSQCLINEAKRIIYLYGKGRLTAANARYFLDMISWVDKYFKE